MSELNGVLPVDKPVGPTSHDIVSVARRALGTRRIGHTGTLDPFASGLLLLCIGRATRLAEYLTALPKQYRATLRLGAETTTDDVEGEVVRTSDAWREVSRAAVEAAFARRVGEQLQLPPKYSAKKVGGERMYEIARSGREVPREPVPVRIERIEVIRFALPEIDFEVDCSSGTYIRSIARDVGDDLGVGAHLAALRRTRVGPHPVSSALPVDRMDDREVVTCALLDPAAAVAHLPSIVVGAGEAERLRHGRPVDRPDARDADPVSIVSDAGELIAIGRVEEGQVRPRKVVG